MRSFDNFCDENGFVSKYYRVPRASLALYKSLNKKSMLVGEEAILNITTYTLEGGKMKTTRSAVNRLTSEGCNFKVYEPPVKAGLPRSWNKFQMIGFTTWGKRKLPSHKVSSIRPS